MIHGRLPMPRDHLGHDPTALRIQRLALRHDPTALAIQTLPLTLAGGLVELPKTTWLATTGGVSAANVLPLPGANHREDLSSAASHRGEPAISVCGATAA